MIDVEKVLKKHAATYGDKSYIPALWVVDAAKEIAAAVREECAKACEKITFNQRKRKMHEGFLAACDAAESSGHKLATLRCAAAIRALEIGK